MTAFRKRYYAASGTEIRVRKNTAGTIAKHQLVYVVTLDAANECFLVELAKADAAATMPAIGITLESVTDTDPTESACVRGTVEGIDTSSYSQNDVLYVDPAVAGGLTATKPTSPDIVQAVALVTYVHATDGCLEFYGAGRAIAGPISDQSMVKARRTTTYALTAAYVDITLDTTDFENEPTIVEHDDVNTDRIKLKDAGPYLITYHAQIAAPSPGDTSLRIEARVRANDATVIAGSDSQATAFDDGSIPGGAVEAFVTRSFIYNAAANDYVSLQLQRVVMGGSDETTTLVDLTVSVIRLTGERGAAGPAGSGATIVVQDEGGTVAGGPHDTLDFVGAPVTVTDAGAGKATVTVADPTSDEATATGTTSTALTAFTQAASMTITPPSGTYLAWFTSSMSNSATNAEMFAAIYSGGSIVASSEREARRGGSQADTKHPFCCVAKVTVNGSQAIQGMWHVSAGTGTMHDRVLTILKVA